MEKILDKYEKQYLWRIEQSAEDGEQINKVIVRENLQEHPKKYIIATLIYYKERYDVKGRSIEFKAEDINLFNWYLKYNSIEYEITDEEIF